MRVDEEVEEVEEEEGGTFPNVSIFSLFHNTSISQGGWKLIPFFCFFIDLVCDTEHEWGRAPGEERQIRMPVSPRPVDLAAVSFLTSESKPPETHTHTHSSFSLSLFNQPLYFLISFLFFCFFIFEICEN